jgi:hypothetical protein
MHTKKIITKSHFKLSNKSFLINLMSQHKIREILEVSRHMNALL